MSDATSGAGRGAWRLAALQAKLEHALAGAEKELQGLRRAWRLADDAIGELQHERDQEERSLAVQGQRLVDPARRIAALRYLQVQSDDLRTRRAALAALEQRVGVAAGQVTTLRRKLETLEQLRDDEQQLRLRARDRAAQRAADLAWLVHVARVRAGEERVPC